MDRAIDDYREQITLCNYQIETKNLAKTTLCPISIVAAISGVEVNQ